MAISLDASVLAKVVNAVRNAGHLHEEQITAGTRFAEDLAFDSLDLVELAICLEEDFEVELSEDAISRFGCVGDIVGYLSRRRLLTADEPFAPAR